MDPEDPGSIVLTEFAALESQAVGPPTSPVEMSCEGDDWDTITTRLAPVIPLDGTSGSGDDIKQLIADYGNSYPALFAAVFGEVTPGADAGDAGAGEITAVRIAMAIATHERRLKSDQTPFDLWVDGIDVPSNEGGACNNGDACTASVCSSGACEVGPAVDCEDNDPCTNDSCDGATGCVNEPIEGCNIQSVPFASDSGRLVLTMMLVLVGLGFGYWRTHPRVVSSEFE